MHITSAIKSHFYDLYFVQEISKSDIESEMGLSEKQYINLVKIVKRMDKATIDTDFMEQQIKRRLIVDPNDRDALKAAIEIWKYKYKVGEPPSTLLDGDIV